MKERESERSKLERRMLNEIKVIALHGLTKM